jgi:membrane protein
MKNKISFIFQIIKALFKKYQRDNANIIVSSISFYILLTFIPFTLLSIYILGNVIDMSNPAGYLEKFIKNIIPHPYNVIIVKKVIRELNIISISKRLSGPLGVLFLFFFTTRLFTVIRSSFRIIFGKHPEKFFKGKGKELLFTILFSVIQALLFFSFIFSVIIHTKITQMLPYFITKTIFIYAFSLLDMFFTFIMFYLLYYFLTPTSKVRKTHIIFISTIIATLLWHLGKGLFKYYILHIGKFTAFFGTYGVFVAFLFWIYFSVFVFITCAELQAVLVGLPNRGPLPSSSPSPEKPSEAPED